MLTPQQIKALRKSLKMTPTALAALVGVSDNTVRRWEIGDRHPNYKRMMMLNDLAKKHGIELEAPAQKHSDAFEASQPDRTKDPVPA